MMQTSRETDLSTAKPPGPREGRNGGIAGALVTVFGGTGFLGSQVVRSLRARQVAVRIASRHPQQARRLFGDEPGVQSVVADVHDDASVAAALRGATGVVNAVSLYAERGRATFQSVHVESARRIALHARDHHVRQLAHLSGIGAEPDSPSSYVRSRAEGERAVLETFPAATVVRPAVMFAPDDAFLTRILSLLDRLPVYPMFGNGRTRLQPVHVGDVAEALARLVLQPPGETPSGSSAPGIPPGRSIYVFAGPRIYTYQELLELIAHAAGLRTRLIPVPFALWRVLARLAEILPHAPLTRGQVELMQVDSVAAAQTRGLDQLGIAPRSIEEILPELLARN
jgi:NADH dehydrogenase